MARIEDVVILIPDPQRDLSIFAFQAFVDPHIRFGPVNRVLRRAGLFLNALIMLRTEFTE
jgi:hypothetical protein